MTQEQKELAKEAAENYAGLMVWINKEGGETELNEKSILFHEYISETSFLAGVEFAAASLINQQGEDLKTAYTKGWQDRAFVGERTEFNSGAFYVKLNEYLKSLGSINQQGEDLRSVFNKKIQELRKESNAWTFDANVYLDGFTDGYDWLKGYLKSEGSINQQPAKTEEKSL